MLRVHLSRALARVLLGDGRTMLCARAHWHRHWSEPALDVLVFWQRHHCRQAAAWEAREAIRDAQEELCVMECPPVTRNEVDEARRAGWL